MERDKRFETLSDDAPVMIWALIANLRGLRDQVAAFPGSATQERQIELGQAVGAALEDLQAEDREMILDRLDPLALAVADNETPGEHEVVNAAFLVERESRPSFDEAVGTLRKDVEARIKLRYVGPQPPYSFLEPVRTGEIAWD